MTELCATKGVTEFGCNLISWGLYFGYFLLGIALISSIVLPLMNALKNPGVLVKAGIGIGALVVVFVIAYAISSDELSPIAVAQGVSAGSAKAIGAGMIVFYMALIGSAIGLVYSEISKAFK